MTILSDIIANLPANKESEKLQQLCDMISKEENKDIEVKLPSGPNMFLSIFVEPNNSLCLEREFSNSYIVSLWDVGDEKKMMRRKNIPCPYSDCDRVIKFFAEQLNIVKGVKK